MTARACARSIRARAACSNIAKPPASTKAWTGLSTRFAFKVLAATFNHDTVEVAADPVHLMYVLEQSLRREQLPAETEKRYLEFIKAELAPRYAEFIGNEIQKAYLESYQDYGQNLFDRYIDYADAWIEDQDFKDPDTGQMLDRELLNQELTKIEKPAGIANPKDFRNEVVKFALRWRASNKGRNPSWASYEKIRDVIERRMFSQVEDLLPVISFGSKKDTETEKKHGGIRQPDGGARLHRAASAPSRRVVHARKTGRLTGKQASCRRAEERAQASMMRCIVDRRLNPGGKSFANRQRFLRRAKDMVERAVREASRDRAIGDLENPGEVTIPAEGHREPLFRHTPGARRDLILPGNREYVEGDLIDRPRTVAKAAGGPLGRGDGSGGRLPIRAHPRRISAAFSSTIWSCPISPSDASSTPKRRGCGAPATPRPARRPISRLGRTMQMSLARRIALGRPKRRHNRTTGGRTRRRDGGGSRGASASTARRAAGARARRVRIPYLDPVDLRYRRFERFPKPVAQAVMFCLMDVSGSMTEHMKDLAKRFFMLLHVFLTRRYERVELVFIRHTDKAHEVDEETFFRSTETGGTMVSSALTEMARIIKDRYDPASWNIYAAQASDGDNLLSDNERTRELLQDVILPLCQYFAYVEVAHPNADAPSSAPHKGRSSLWMTYATLRNNRGGSSRCGASRAATISIPCFGNCSNGETSALRGLRNERRFASFRGQGLGFPDDSAYS